MCAFNFINLSWTMCKDIILNKLHEDWTTVVVYLVFLRLEMWNPNMSFQIFKHGCNVDSTHNDCIETQVLIVLYGMIVYWNLKYRQLSGNNIKLSVDIISNS